MKKTLTTPSGELKIEILGHASYIFDWNGHKIYFDPWSKVTDYTDFPKADYIFITHDHYDHLDMGALKHIIGDNTFIIANSQCVETLRKLGVKSKMESVSNCDELIIGEYNIEAVPAYNIINVKDNGEPFHPKGVGNGYILEREGFRVYVAGDTELIPEMKSIKNVSLALLPKNLPYTMSDSQFLEAANMIKPNYLIATHYFEIDVVKLKDGLTKGIELLNE